MTTEVKSKQIGIVRETDWSAPKMSTEFWGEVVRYIQMDSNTLTLEDVETAFEEFTDSLDPQNTDDTALLENAKAFVEWFRNHYKSINYPSDYAIFVME